MRRVLKWFGFSFIGVVFAAGLFFVYMRLHDGPIEFWPGFTISTGGPFRSGELAASPADWTFLKEREEIEMETLNLGTSKTIWTMVIDGRLFVASGRRQTWYGQLWKQWPQRIEDDDRIILRVDDTLYEQKLVPITEGEIILPVLRESWRKYGRGSEPTSDMAVTGEFMWLFEIVDRT
ncbi:MAG: hypothetical protein OXU66_03655 [Gammaproteobacteria bacterium]|nr:hypothetical protein [Gammaproteobacteria bacterium]MDD9895089.1 hypothetical protein [Gammaproteobacteria bacterium]MDD9958014.1 hypothetical protein [Gammaproteobacteria bacterium]